MSSNDLTRDEIGRGKTRGGVKLGDGYNILPSKGEYLWFQCPHCAEDYNSWDLHSQTCRSLVPRELKEQCTVCQKARRKDGRWYHKRTCALLRGGHDIYWCYYCVNWRKQSHICPLAEQHRRSETEQQLIDFWTTRPAPNFCLCGDQSAYVDIPKTDKLHADSYSNIPRRIQCAQCHRKCS